MAHHERNNFAPIDKDGLPTPFPDELRDAPESFHLRQREVLLRLWETSRELAVFENELSDHLKSIAGLTGLDYSAADPSILFSLGPHRLWSDVTDLSERLQGVLRNADTSRWKE